MGSDYTRLYNQIKKDYNYIRENFGEVYEFCEVCMSDTFEELLNNPSKQVAFWIFVRMMRQYFYRGYDEAQRGRELPLEDEKIKQIYKRWESFLEDK